MPISAATFKPAWWCRGGHLQTIAGALLRADPMLAVQRQRWNTPDGDFIDLDRICDPAANAPRLLLLHGLEGSASSRDICQLMAAAGRLGWESIGLNFRSCSGEPNRLRRAYHAGDTADLAWVIERLIAEAAERPLLCLGISLGGNVLLKYLGERGADVPSQLLGAVTISTPFNLNAGVDYVEQGLSRLYVYRFITSLKQKMYQKLDRYPDLVDRDALRAVRSLSDFDALFTAPVHGFPDAETYWRQSSSLYLLPVIRCPTLLINAQNDPFYPAAALPRQQVATNPFLTGLFPADGGHGGFIEKGWPFRLQSWAQQQAMAYFQQCLSAGTRTATLG
ncbi:MAG: alpha/beta fold hydrolase [Leptolyngbya sp. SIO4C1]|nr:alpha/beta fold hydrolase [Leptolyngbya sp. SIO4C1]